MDSNLNWAGEFGRRQSLGQKELREIVLVAE